MVGLAVPVMKNFKGLTQLMASVDYHVRPYVINNWDHNHGVPHAWNVAIDWALENHESHLIISNDDIVFHPGTIKKLVDNSKYAHLLSTVSTDTGEEGIHFADFPDFACFIIRPEQFVNMFGYFDEHFYPAYFEDNDMTYRIKVSGGRQGLLLDARVDHSGSVTQNWEGQPVVTSQMFEANRAYYKAKWGGVPGEEKFTTPHNQPHLSIKDI